MATRDQPFEHLALLYEGEGEFAARTLPFVREGLDAGEAVLVATDAAKGERLSADLAGDRAGGEVEFVDVTELGRNPACLLPLWMDFVGDHDRPVRGVGEPAWPGRSPAELAECHHHEALINLAFEDRAGFRLLCPYDTAALPPEVADWARATHPSLLERGGVVTSPGYLPPGAGAGPFSGRLEPAPADAAVREFGACSDLRELRSFVSGVAREAGFDEQRSEDLAFATNELAANSLHHGGGGGTLAIWRDRGALVCEVRDAGWIEEPLTGRRRPAATAVRGRGLWLVNRICDLVQIRSSAAGTVVRVRIDPDTAATA